MIRIVLCSFIVWCLSANAALAQEIKIRAGEHDGYSRLVFDLDGAADYTVKTLNPETLEIFFPDGALSDDFSLNAKNFIGVKKVSADPLTLHVQTYNGAKYRNLKLGSRLVLDVYDLPGQENLPRPEPERQEAPPAEEPQVEKPQKDIEKKEEELAEGAESENKVLEETRTEKEQEETQDSSNPSSVEEKPSQEETNAKAEEDTQNNAEVGIEKEVRKAQLSGILKDKKLPNLSEDLKGEEEGQEQTAEEEQNKEEEKQENTEDQVSEDQGEQKQDASLPAEKYKIVELPPSPNTINAMLYGAEDEAEKNQDSEAEEERDYSKTKLVARSNLIAISSTEKFGMAVFEEAGRLWMVADKGKIVLNQQVAGPQKDYFLPLEEASIRGGTIMTTRTMEGANIETRGGDLLWEIVSKPEKVKYEPLKAKRKFESASALDGGIVIFPFEHASAVLDMKDPLTGADLKVVTSINSKEYSGPPREFVEFETLQTYAGLAIRPKIDNLQVKVTKRGVEITRKNGLNIMPSENLVAARTNAMKEKIIQQELDDGTYENTVSQRIFFFDVWEMGAAGVLSRNANIILAAMKDLTKAGQVEDLINLAKMHLANGRGAEALGFLRYAKTEMPRIATNPEFIALRGAANIFDSKIEAGYHDIMSARLDDYPEIKLWRASIFASLGDWQRAAYLMGDRFLPLYSYPPEIRNRLGLILAEIALRDGNVDNAETIFRIIEIDKESLSRPSLAAMKYLKGEAARQKGELDTTKELWKGLSKGKDELFRTKAGLALAILMKQEREIDIDEAIDRLERLRYSWRGDALEAQVNFWLGKLYFEKNQYIKGLRIKREAITFAKGTLLSKKIAAHMSDAFTDLFIGDKLEAVSPLDAVAIYEQFSELTPSGPDGNRVVSSLVEHLVDADLLERAGDLLAYQINHRLAGNQAARAATRLAAIRLIDEKPTLAIEALQRSNSILKTLPPIIADRNRFLENTLLRARAISQQGNPQDALELLDSLRKTPNVNRLKATIAWDAQYWDDAADALKDVLLDENVTGDRGRISDEQAVLVLNRAIALNLAGDRIALGNMRERYTRVMNQTKQSRMFEVVSRERRNAGLADRETLLSVTSEVDLFRDFLNNYRREDIAF